MLRIGAMLVLTLSVMLIVYPALHEAGHMLAGWCAGAIIKGVEVFPLPHTVLYLSGLSRMNLLATAFGGSLLPLLALAIPGSRHYSLYHIKLTIALITLVSSAESLVCGLPGSGCDDDAALVLTYFPDMQSVVWMLSAALSAGTFLFCVFTRPVTRITAFLIGETSIAFAERKVLQKGWL